ncbi:DUF255 domain-containing protein [candidate division GN15 bacterium]|nr:DUF255 domain-containing protein [candidate division GN15 bacterium]
MTEGNTTMSDSSKTRRHPLFSAILISVFLACIVAVAPSVLAQDEVSPFGLAGGDDENIVSVRSMLSATAVAPGDTVDAAVVVTIAPTWHINSAEPYEDFLIPSEVTVGDVTGISTGAPLYPAAHDVTLMESPMSVYDDEIVIVFPVVVSADLGSGDYTLPVSFTAQPCNDRTCLPPRTKEAPLTVTVGSGGQPANEALFGSQERTPFVDPNANVESADKPSAETSGEQSELLEIIDQYGFWGYFMILGIAFITGLLLSFSPCTYPMIPITVSIFAGQQRSVGKGFVMSLFYVGSMAIVYGIMGLVVSLVGGVFGAWLASPPVVIGIVVIFIVFALSMFGLYELQVPAGIRNKLGQQGGGGGGGVVGAIILGIVAALVVSPCVGPFVAGILLYVATSGSPVFGFLVLFVFALGLGTLFVIIGTFSNAINKLPRSGEWMEQVKKFFGFVLLLMAIYFLRTLVSPTLTAVLTGIVLLVFGVFGGGLDRLTSDSGFFPRLKKLLGMVAFLIGAYLLLGTFLMHGFVLPKASEWLPVGGGQVAVEKAGIPWETDLDAALQRAEAEQKPVLIDTWATWCVNCKVLEEKTFEHPDVVAAAEAFVPVKVQLETRDSPATRDFKQRFGLKQYSLPTTVILTKTGDVHRIMPGVIGPEEMLEYMSEVR